MRAAFAEHGDRIAAVIVEAAAANMGVVPPEPGFNRALVELAHANGSLVISDEVLTGFRVSSAGWWGLEQGTAGEYTPDLLTFGKVIGGGMPVAALGGRADIMQQLAPLGPVYQAGTLSGNPVAVAAGVATLQGRGRRGVRAPRRRRRDDQRRRLRRARRRGRRPRRAARRATCSASCSATTWHPGCATTRACSARRRGATPPFFHAMLDAGVSLPPSVFEAWFVTAAHDDAAIGRIVDALPAAARAAASARPA